MEYLDKVIQTLKECTWEDAGKAFANTGVMLLLIVVIAIAYAAMDSVAKGLIKI